MIDKKLIIAIDGPSASGKSTTAKLLAHRLSYIYVDTGAMYRAVTLAYLRFVEADKFNTFNDLMISINIKLKYNNNSLLVLLNGEDVTNKIRLPEVTKSVSYVASQSIVRKRLVEIQQEMGLAGGIVMDGRDIGTVVFSDADLKIYLVASPAARAKRRFEELVAKGIDTTFNEILVDLERRDKFDSEREISPLKKAVDAIELDNSNMTIDEQVDFIYQAAKEKLNNSHNNVSN